MNAARCAASVVAVIGMAGIALAAGPVRRDLQFKVGKHSVISVTNQFGPITVKPGATHHVTITALLHSDKVEIDQSQSGNRVDLISHLLNGADESSGAVEYEIQVPPDANVTLHSGSGLIHAEKLQGDLSLEGTNAVIEVVDCSNGHVHVKTLNGPVSLKNIRNGHVEITSMGGDVALEGVDGPFVQVNSNSGKIQYSGDFGAAGDYEFTSHTGNIEALAPASASIDVLARSTTGPVQSDFSLEPRHTPFAAKVGSAFSGTLGMAASSVRLFSFSGKIHLKKRQN
jgi:DUF4097 and DUF4098 domain-containing protein YvlB